MGYVPPAPPPPAVWDSSKYDSDAMTAMASRIYEGIYKPDELIWWASYGISTGPGKLYRDTVKPKANCRNCGAPYHANSCEYCGTEF